MQELRQNTAITLPAGPFLDEDDGKTIEAALTILKDDVRLSANGGGFAAKNSLSTITQNEKGFYLIPHDITDTSVLGRLKRNIHKTGALPVFDDFMVISKEKFDAKYGNQALDAGHLVRLATKGTLEERTLIESGTINRATYPHYGVLFTATDGGGATNLDFDPNIMEGAIIENTALLSEGKQRFFQILGGYYFNDTGDTTEKVFGIALTKPFSITEGGTVTVDTNWSGLDIDEPSNGDGWTFIVAPKSVVNNDNAAFPDSDQVLRVWINPAIQRIKSLFPDGAVYFDGTTESGLDYPAGSIKRPSDDIGNSVAIANLNNIKVIKILADVGSGNPIFDRFKLIGIGSATNARPNFNFSGGKTTQKTQFKNLNLSGQQADFGDFRYIKDCEISDALALSLNNDNFDDCYISDITNSFGFGNNNDKAQFKNCAFKNAKFHDAAQTGNILELHNCTGEIDIAKVSTGIATIDGFEGIINIAKQADIAGATITINGGGGKILIDTNMTTGSVIVNGGDWNIVDNKTSGTVTINKVDTVAAGDATLANQTTLLTRLPSVITFSGGNVHTNVKMIDNFLVADDGAGRLLVKNEDGNKIGTDAQQTTIINHLADIKGAGWVAAENLKNIYADTNETQGKLPATTIAAAGDKMDLIDTLKHIAGSSGFNRTTDSLEAIGTAAAGIVSKATLKDLLFFRNVLTRHTGVAAGKPKTIAIGSGGGEGTVTTTVDGEFIKQETQA